jgi:hypothetical protein
MPRGGAEWIDGFVVIVIVDMVKAPESGRPKGTPSGNTPNDQYTPVHH